jgi:hypothetical protein
VAFKLEATLVADGDRTVLVEDDPVTIGILDSAEILVDETSAVLRLDRGLLEAG